MNEVLGVSRLCSVFSYRRERKRGQRSGGGTSVPEALVFGLAGGRFRSGRRGEEGGQTVAAASGAAEEAPAGAGVVEGPGAVAAAGVRHGVRHDEAQQNGAPPAPETEEPSNRPVSLHSSPSFRTILHIRINIASCDYKQTYKESTSTVRPRFS